MTPKEAELLRAVETLMDHLDSTEYSADGWFGAKEAVRSALSAYRSKPQEAEGEMVTLGLMRSRPSGRLSATLKPDQEDPRHWQHIGNLVFRMPPDIVLPTIPAKVEP